MRFLARVWFRIPRDPAMRIGLHLKKFPGSAQAVILGSHVSATGNSTMLKGKTSSGVGIQKSFKLLQKQTGYAYLQQKIEKRQAPKN